MRACDKNTADLQSLITTVSTMSLSSVNNQLSHPRGADSVPIPPSADASSLDFAETSSVTLEWRLTGLKSIFEGSKGESKSKCIKSAVFGDPESLWEIIFYPNSGSPSSSSSGGGGGNAAGQSGSQLQPGGGGVSLNSQNQASSSQAVGEYSSFYLSAVPTEEEKAKAIKGKWTRNGLYGFRFEIKPTMKGGAIASKEASNHQFSYKTVNWGWQR